MRHTAPRFVAGLTLNHTKSPLCSSWHPPPPPALPRFALDFDDDPLEGDVLDPFDVAETTRRPTVDARAARRAVTRSQVQLIANAPGADGTSEIAAEDILFETYVEEPPPPPASRRAYVAPVAPEVASHAHSYDQETPSVAPVAFPSIPMMVASPYGPSTAAEHEAMNAPTAIPPSRGAGAGAIAAFGGVLLVLSLGVALAVTAGLKNGSVARAKHAETATMAASPSPEPMRTTMVALDVPAPPAPPAPTTLPSVSVDSLPRPAIAANQTLVTFPASAQGHRVFFDGRPMAVTPAPLALRCGRHTIRIGSAGKVRVTDLACGQGVTLTR